MRPSRDARRTTLRLAAVLMVALFAGSIGHVIVSTPPEYLESATVVFSLPKSDSSPSTYNKFARSGITSAEAMVQILMSPQDQRQIRQAGGAASVNLALVNLYSQQYPNYGVPLATLTAESRNAGDTHRTFVIAARQLGHLITARQAKVGVTARNRISIQVIADTGPTVQAGSLKRILAGLAVLALAAVGALWGRIDRMGSGPNPPRYGRKSPVGADDAGASANSRHVSLTPHATG